MQKTSRESRRGLDLSGLHTATIGGGPPRAETMERFLGVFGEYGFRREAFCNGYGLAEATLSVSGARDPRVLTVDRAALERNQVRTASSGDNTLRLVSAGTPAPGERIVIVDPRTRVACPPDRIGEVWVSGDNVAPGYWRKPAESAATFGGFTSPGNEGPFLRTGDLGFLHDGELYIAGRLKDLMIVRGRNVHPQDLEETVARCHPAVRAGFGAAVSVDEEAGGKSS